MQIPYATTPRPDTGVTNATLGIWLFLASEIMLFGSLFSSYAILRSGADNWPDQSAVLNVRLAAVNTFVLLVSSVAIVRAASAARIGRIAQCRRYGAMALLGGVVFLGIKLAEYRDKIAHDMLPSTSNFLGLYYAITGLHALHVAAGLLVISYVIGPGARLWRTDPERYTGRMGVASVYWNFVDAVWLCVFVTLYVL